MSFEHAAASTGSPEGDSVVDWSEQFAGARDALQQQFIDAKAALFAIQFSTGGVALEAARQQDGEL